MTLLELNDVLGKGINDITNTKGNTRDHENALENAEFIAKLAKQIINNADVILRTDKICGRNDRANKIVGDLK